MKETKFKSLMHCGMYVDANKLGKGIYNCSKPFIYDKEATIETLIHQGQLMQDMIGQGFVSEKYFENLNKCQLVAVIINVDDKTPMIDKR